MGFESFIGLRYLRAKRKTSFVSVITFISILGITVGVSALIIVLAVMTGFEEDLKKKILGINSHIVVSAFGGSAIYDYNEVTAKIRTVDGVTGASPFIYGQALLSTEDGVMGVVVRGVERETLGDVSILPDKMIDGSLEALDKSFKDTKTQGGVPGIVIGAELANILGVRVGTGVNVVTPSVRSSLAGGSRTGPRMTRLEVVGIFEVGMYEYDSTLAFISLENAQSFFKVKDSATGIEVKTSDAYRAEEIRNDIKDVLKGGTPYFARTWMEMNKNLFSALKLEKAAMFIILMLVVMVAALNIISTLIMVVMQKGKEIAILKSLGATSRSIMKIFMIEGVVIGLVGTFLGTVIGLLTALNLEAIVRFIENTFNFRILPPSIYYIDKLPSKVEPMTVLAIIIISLAISFLATVYPSWKASRFTPVEGLRYE
ncbi:MAG: lipoprotein-releasing ABC transporter permease subunit [Deltaproteobacteria bacterium]|nr:lipoprotein-releasing ABC transporter permease subunit [Deltaproteobacteria bacterium]